MGTCLICSSYGSAFGACKSRDILSEYEINTPADARRVLRQCGEGYFSEDGISKLIHKVCNECLVRMVNNLNIVTELAQTPEYAPPLECIYPQPLPRSGMDVKFYELFGFWPEDAVLAKPKKKHKGTK